jgi:two-component system, cell cycle sensor histidine kinase and response regulator CckA
MKPTVFVVEDDELFAKYLAVSLRGGGYTMGGLAASGEEALHEIGRLHTDLVLMDMNLSGKLDGVDTAEQIRTEYGLPVIFLTASDDQSLLHRAKYTDPFGYLAKPFRQQDLVSAIEIALHRHRIERKLKQREAWLATTLRCAGEGMIVTDAAGHIELINEIAKRILDIHETNVIGQKFSEVVRLSSRLTGVPAGDLVQLAILQGSTMDIGNDLSVASALQGEVEIEGEISLSETAGCIAGTVFTFRDSTVRHHQEEQHRQGLRKRAVIRLAEALSSDLRQLQQTTIESIQELLDLIETGQPMRPGVEIMKVKYVNASSRVLHQLGALQRREPAFPQALDLNALLTGIYRDLAVDMPAGIELSAQLSPGLGKIVADSTNLKQAIISVILYLRDALSGKGKISVSTRACGLELRGRSTRADRYVRLSIASTNGAPAKEQAGASGTFEPFSGVNASAEKLDLRLFAVQGIIADSRGSISAQMNPGHGLAFEIVLPQGTNAAEQRAAAPTSESGLAPAVLVIEKDNDIRDLVLAELDRNGFEALGARDAQEALEWVDLYAAPIALLITELDMPGISGTALTERISARHSRLHAIFIAHRAVSPALREQWSKRGCRFLERPFRLDDLLTTVSDMLLAVHPQTAQRESQNVSWLAQ